MNDRVDPLRFIAVEQAGPGRVLAVDADGHLRVQCRAEVVTMALAVSCLVVPRSGDRVWWCAAGSDGEGDDAGADTHWVTHVLARDPSAPATLRLPRDTTLQSAGGMLRLAADDLRLEGDAVQLRARHATLLFDTAETVGACWQGVITAMRWTGTTLSAVVDRITSVAKTRQQFTEGSDLVQAGTLDLRSAGLATLHAEHLLVEAERLVKTRAPQIHMG